MASTAPSIAKHLARISKPAVGAGFFDHQRRGLQEEEAKSPHRRHKTALKRSGRGIRAKLATKTIISTRTTGYSASFFIPKNGLEVSGSFSTDFDRHERKLCLRTAA